MSRNPIYIRLINSKEWKQLRLKKLMNDPVCEECEKSHRSTLAIVVHHMVPVESVPTETRMKVLMFSYDNLMSVCPDCHAAIHQQMFSHTKESVKANNKRKIESFIDKFLK